MPLHSQLNDLHNQLPPKRQGPLWRGPEEDGVTFSLLSRFLVCRERFRLLVVEGLRAADRWDHKLGYGNMWHTCEESMAAPNPDFTAGGCEMSYGVMNALNKHSHQQCKRYPTQQSEIVHWHGIYRTQFPLYVRHWHNHPDQLARRPLLSEQVFCVPYQLPSGRTVRLRGKWDSVDLVGEGKETGIWLQENKTKSRIDPVRMVRQLGFDLQTMLYLVALQTWEFDEDMKLCRSNSLKGVRYNVVRRTEHRQGKKETPEGFLKRLQGIIETDPEEWFYRWNIILTADDVAKFRRQCLDPILEQLCDWWNAVIPIELRSTHGGGPVCRGYCTPLHWRHPFGVYNVLDEGGSSDLDNYLMTGQEAGLQRTSDLFPELG
jgi:PD-(D/E)XK nuclease superfamily